MQIAKCKLQIGLGERRRRATPESKAPPESNMERAWLRRATARRAAEEGRRRGARRRRADGARRRRGATLEPGRPGGTTAPCPAARTRVLVTPGC